MLQENEVVVRLGFFFGTLFLMFIWELLAPKRQLSVSKTKRWISNLLIVFIDSVIIRLLFPAAAVGAALYAQQNNLGLFNHISYLNHWLAVVASVVIFRFGDLFTTRVVSCYSAFLACT